MEWLQVTRTLERPTLLPDCNTTEEQNNQMCQPQQLTRQYSTGFHEHKNKT
jgi:hypothetical protein